ncbi:MAG TPA: ThiF family adenylyltransferase [Tepidisphaeraceae bacterium]|nr:ThiF family adenylyltransferase [Tepidisphaeraceae bacterium]
MNFERIRPTIDVDRMQQAHVTVVGGAYGLTQDLVRCGVGAVTYVDFDRVDATNPARQDFGMADVGRHKADALAEALARINPDVEVNCLTRDFCEFGRDEFDAHFGHTDLLILATDFFPAQARGNREAMRLGKPALSIGLYRGGRAGEIIYHVPGVTPACYRCVASARYRAFEAQARAAAAPAGPADAGGVNVPSTGGTVLDLHLVDAIAGQVAVGILTAGADNRMGRLIAQLGNRNLLQVKIDPEYRMGERDIFGRHLGDGPANFSFTTIALPQEPEADCLDCALARATVAAHCHSHGGVAVMP